MSDRAIAELCGVGYSLVAASRPKQLPDSGSSTALNCNNITVEPRTGLDGKTRNMPEHSPGVTAEIPPRRRTCFGSPASNGGYAAAGICLHCPVSLLVLANGKPSCLAIAQTRRPLATNSWHGGNARCPFRSG